MQSTPPWAREAEVRSIEDLETVFRHAEKPASQFRIGAEAEKFGVEVGSAKPIAYSGPRSILSVFERFEAQYGWTRVTESEGGPVIALERELASITLEPGGQLELSGSPCADVHAISAEFVEHFRELGGISEELGLEWWSLGFHPTAAPEDLPWVPKQRYAIMKEYLPSRGSRGRDMMQRTATVQANFDYESEEDALRKLRAVLRLAPVFQAMCANAPFFEGRVSNRASERLHVWLNMDPDRSGLIPRLWARERPRYRDYVEWALDAGMFFIKRGSGLVLNTGQTFRDYLANGFQGHRATFGDWFRHLATLFPDARLKSTLEVRTCDALPERLTMAVPALFTGVLYDARALDALEELAAGVPLDVAVASRREVADVGLHAHLGARPIRDIAERIIDLARQGLGRRARRNAAGQDESIYLRPLADLLAAGRCPADELRGARRPGDVLDPAGLAPVRVAASGR